MVLLQGFFLDFGFSVRETGRTREWIGVLPYRKGWLVARVVAITLRKEASSKLFMQVAAAVL
jgi:hypothetical protein